MATALNVPSLPQPSIVTSLPKKLPPVIPIKAGFMGEQGTGKTTTAGLLAAALSVQFHDRAPIHVTDPELGWQFLNPVIFHPERIQLVQRTVPTFAAMLEDMERAEREGACVWAVELGKIWIEIVRTLQKKDPIGWGMQLRSMWDDFVARFLNSKMHCLVLGRIQDVIEQVMMENGSIQSVKTGEGMKAGGQKNNFGYEPHLVFRMSLEIKPRVKKGKTFIDEGRFVHRAQVAKDRTWALNGKVFRWQDRDGYKPGEFRFVWNDLKPHFDAVQLTMQRPTLDTLRTSAEIIRTDDNGHFYREREERERFAAEIRDCLNMYFAGQGKEDKQTRLAVNDLIFGVKSKEAADSLPLHKLERGLRILLAYEKLVKHNLDSKDAVLQQIAECVEEYDRGDSEIDLPF
jgi:hypothetical protein